MPHELRSLRIGFVLVGEETIPVHVVESSTGTIVELRRDQRPLGVELVDVSRKLIKRPSKFKALKADGHVNLE